MDADSFWLWPDLSLGHSWTHSMALVLLLSTRACFSERHRRASLVTADFILVLWTSLSAFLKQEKSNSLEKIWGIGLFGNDSLLQGFAEPDLPHFAGIFVVSPERLVGPFVGWLVPATAHSCALLKAHPQRHQ